jgi:enoyl-CoA hydratase/carnithine racemase
MADQFQYISRARLEYRDGYRRAYLGEVPEPVVYGVQGALRDYYGAKEAVAGGLGLPLADGIRLENDLATLLRTTEDRVEGAKAFVEKRKPTWTGR